MASGSISPASVVDTEFNHSCIKIVDETYGELTLPRVFNSPSRAIYELEVIVDEKFICRSVTVDKNTNTWTYAELNPLNNVKLDDEYLKLNADKEVSLDVDKTKEALDGTITSGDINFPTGGTIYTKLTSYVPQSRKINGKALTDDMTLEGTDISGAVPETRTVNGHALDSDITLSCSEIGLVPNTRKINGKALSSDITISWSDIKDLKHVYAHHINWSTSASDIINFTLINNSSSALTGYYDIAKALYNAGYKSSDKCLYASGIYNKTKYYSQV